MNILLKNKAIYTLFSNKQYFNYAAILVLLFLLLLNYVFKITYGMNIILIIVLLFAIARKDGITLFKDWFPMMLLFYFYEVSRSYAYEIAKFFEFPLHVASLIDIEKFFFEIEGVTPTEWLQDVINPMLSNPQWFDYVLLIFYGVFFWGWALAGYYFWLRNRSLYRKYIYGLVGFSLVSVLIFIMLPTAPPWYASDTGLIEPVERLLWQFQYFGEFTFASIQEYGRNDFAAIPSLHTGWTFYMALFFIKDLGKRGFVFMIIPLGVAFATWYGAEHYVIDSIIGAAMATIAFILANRYVKEVSDE